MSWSDKSCIRAGTSVNNESALKTIDRTANKKNARIHREYIHVFGEDDALDGDSGSLDSKSLERRGE